MKNKDNPIWIAQPTMVFNKNGWTQMVQIPSFLLDENIQGIVDQAQAEWVVKRILNPLDDPGITVNPNVIKE